MPEELSKITMRLHEIQTELDDLTGGRKLGPNEHESHGHRKKSSNRNYSSGRSY